MVVLVPVPVVVVLPGVLVNVQVPDDGKPFKFTEPVDDAHVGCVIVPTFGDVCTVGAALILILSEGDEVTPTAFVTV